MEYLSEHKILNSSEVISNVTQLDTWHSANFISIKTQLFNHTDV